MKIICERNILIHQRPEYRISDEPVTEKRGAVPSPEELKKGRKFHIIGSSVPQDVPDWIEDTDQFKFLTEKGVIQVIKFVPREPRAKVAAASDEEFDSLAGKTKEQLRAFAKEKFNLELDASLNKNELIEAILEAKEAA